MGDSNWSLNEADSPQKCKSLSDLNDEPPKGYLREGGLVTVRSHSWGRLALCWESRCETLLGEQTLLRTHVAILRRLRHFLGMIGVSWTGVRRSRCSRAPFPMTTKKLGRELELDPESLGHMP